MGLSLAVLATSCGGWMVLHGLGDAIQRVDAIGGGSDRPADEGLTTFLVAGTDEREGIPENTLKNVLHAGGESCHCTDTLMVVQLAGNGGRATVVSIPRDSYVEIPAHQDPATHRQVPAANGKINAAYGMGGAPLTVRTVEQATGLRIDHYLQINFLGFVSAVDALGGVEVCTAKPLKDPYSGLDLPAGTSRLDGAGALKYVRARHVDGSSDLGRMRRQQRFVAQLLRQATAQDVMLDPARLGTVLDSALKAVKADKGLSTAALLDFASRLKDLSAASADFATVPVSDVDHQVPGWGSTVLWDTKAAKALFDTVRQGKPLTGHAAPAPSASPAAAGTVPAGQIRVQVLNGTGLTGLGFRVDEELRRAGFATTGTPSNADAVTTRTAVRYDPRWDESAKTLAAALPGAELVPVPGLGATLQVVVGGDYRGPAAPSGAPSAPAPAAAPASPSTSAPSSASPGPTVVAETGSEISCG
ncbi:LCP family protein [Kitasatospora sp. NPDC093679]|uniref:LCP family protein n=1 Tax=Kitasatospora sp. NPDC093679 TaxID=3154983 RepID=UPI003426687E